MIWSSLSWKLMLPKLSSNYINFKKLNLKIANKQAGLQTAYNKKKAIDKIDAI